MQVFFLRPMIFFCVNLLVDHSSKGTHDITATFGAHQSFNLRTIQISKLQTDSFSFQTRPKIMTSSFTKKMTKEEQQTQTLEKLNQPLQMRLTEYQNSNVFLSISA